MKDKQRFLSFDEYKPTSEVKNIDPAQQDSPARLGLCWRAFCENEKVPPILEAGPGTHGDNL